VIIWDEEQHITETSKKEGKKNSKSVNGSLFPHYYKIKILIKHWQGDEIFNRSE